jgi:hypothetical protein
MKGLKALLLPLFLTSCLEPREIPDNFITQTTDFDPSHQQAAKNILLGSAMRVREFRNNYDIGGDEYPDFSLKAIQVGNNKELFYATNSLNLIHEGPAGFDNARKVHWSQISKEQYESAKKMDQVVFQ